MKKHSGNKGAEFTVQYYAGTSRQQLQLIFTDWCCQLLPRSFCRSGRKSSAARTKVWPQVGGPQKAGPVFVDVYGHLGIDSKNRFRMKN